MFLGLPYHFWYGVCLATLVVVLAEIAARQKGKHYDDT
ncbi:putative membrane protein [Acinetobacter phage vB_AbaP_AS12]|uniref:Putative membrane protein n=1 Tax=Acinetobacter phage vB_AbaP_AS12 TaxID=1932885 RepID=A0A218KRE3_9CAUD|nr:membrane protein [Acinetobacter phage vB_AbaP_AS12]APW79792.1 putative membrane protein [Acinetobacter phage vB_AbaP_AS12]